jgi:hypothetical protein
MQRIHSFDQKDLCRLNGILAEIEPEFAARGRPLTPHQRDEIAHRIMTMAQNGDDRDAIKRYAKGESFADKHFLETL